MDLRNSKEATGWNGENMRSMGGVLRDHIRKIAGGWNAMVFEGHCKGFDFWSYYEKRWKTNRKFSTEE